MNSITSKENIDIFQAQSTTNNFVTQSANILLNEALVLLDYANLFRQAKISTNDDDIKNKVTAEIIKYQNRIQNSIYSNDVVFAASYCICAAIDEAALTGLEDLENNWASETLLCKFHEDTWGGERVFEIYDQARSASQFDLVELIFVLISLGYTGKYFESEFSLSDIRKDNIYKTFLPGPPADNLNFLIDPIPTSQFDVVECVFFGTILAIFIIMICSILNVSLWYIYSAKFKMITELTSQRQMVAN